MLFSTVATIATLSLVDVALSQAVHGSGAKGTTMGPAAFLFPPDRPWSATHDNVGPCGSSEGPGKRANFPLGSAGSVSFSIADDSYKVALRIAYGNNPTSQDEFKQFQADITQFEPGHQCYSVPPPPSSVVAGSNATFQMEYTGNDSGKDETFFACADITYVEAALFDTRVSCFNVTASEFTPAGATPSSVAAPTAAAPGASEAGKGSEKVLPVASSSSGLSAGAKGGIAVGAIAGFALIAGAIFFLVRRGRKAPKDAESGPNMAKVASFTSAESGRRN